MENKDKENKPKIFKCCLYIFVIFSLFIFSSVVVFTILNNTILKNVNSSSLKPLKHPAQNSLTPASQKQQPLTPASQKQQPLTPAIQKQQPLTPAATNKPIPFTPLIPGSHPTQPIILNSGTFNLTDEWSELKNHDYTLDLTKVFVPDSETILSQLSFKIGLGSKITAFSNGLISTSYSFGGKLDINNIKFDLSETSGKINRYTTYLKLVKTTLVFGFSKLYNKMAKRGCILTGIEIDWIRK